MADLALLVLREIEERAMLTLPFAALELVGHLLVDLIVHAHGRNLLQHALLALMVR